MKNPLANTEDARDTGSIPGPGRSPEGGNGNPLLYSGLESPIPRGAWQATVHGVTKSQTQLSDWVHLHQQKQQDLFKMIALGAEIQRGEMGWMLLIFIVHVVILGFCGGSDSKKYAYNRGRPGFHPWFQKIPWRKAWQPTAVFMPGEFHGQRSLMGYSPWDCKESNTTERIMLSHYVVILFWPLKREHAFCWYKLKVNITKGNKGKITWVWSWLGRWGDKGRVLQVND